MFEPSGQRVLTDMGRFGFGEGYREFEMHFPALAAGEARIEFGKLAAEGADRPSGATVFDIAIPWSDRGPQTKRPSFAVAVGRSSAGRRWCPERDTAPGTP